MEEWRVIDWATDYAVSSLGRVKRIKPDRLGRMGKTGDGLLKTPCNDKGYPHLNLHVSGRQYLRTVHKLVCTAFHGPKPTDKCEVRHLDGDPLNNTAVNLAWGTSAENSMDAMIHGTTKSNKPRASKRSPLSAKEVNEIRSSNLSHSRIAEKYGVSRTAIGNIKNSISHTFEIKKGACAVCSSPFEQSVRGGRRIYCSYSCWNLVRNKKRAKG